MLILKAFKLCMDTFASGPKNAAKFRRWSLSIICNNSGDALYRKRLEKYISDNDLPVVWLGEQRSPKAMAECYLAHDVFIHASDVENYCMAASEAVCCGCIIVSTQVGELLTISMSNNLNAEINLIKVKPLKIFRWLKSHNISDKEMLKTFNCGVGFCLIAKSNNILKIQKIFNRKFKPYVIGKIVTGKTKIKFDEKVQW